MQLLVAGLGAPLTHQSSRRAAARKTGSWVAGLVVFATLLIASAPAKAFDTGPHFDISRDALDAEGFGGTAVDVANVNNWFTDFYSNAESVPHSGHSEWWRELLGGAYFAREHWETGVVHSALRSHFDYSSTAPSRRLQTNQDVSLEWDRLRRATWTLATKAQADNSPAALLAAIGMSFHTLQDFYSHSNWVEPQGVAGVDGPNWSARNQGATPTWFDISQGELDKVSIYSTGHPEERRAHGGWHSDRNLTMETGVNKDWPGRPGYSDAYIAAYFASRQWLQAIKSWVNDDGFWNRTQRYANRGGSALNHDLTGARQISQLSGHWQGQGEPVGSGRSGPGGSLIQLRFATQQYFEGRSRTSFRRRFEDMIKVFGDPVAPGNLGVVESSRPIQSATQFVRLQVLKMKGIDLGDTLRGDDADMFSRAVINGQSFLSGEINGHDSYSFPKPNHPFTFIRAVQAGATYREPVDTLNVQVRTSSSRSAGTDDNVYLRVSPTLRFPLDKRLFDDFERGDSDVYSVPIDVAARAGFAVGDIRYLQIEKSPDGVSGGWKLRGVKVVVNGRQIYARDGIERWLEDNKRTWRAPGFTASDPRSPALPVVLDLWEADWGLAGGNDHGDLNLYDRRHAIVRGYAPGAPTGATVTGGSRYGGRIGDSDKARVTYLLDTLIPVLPRAIPIFPGVPIEPVKPADPAPGKPDLIVTDFDFDSVTVKNIGVTAAGPFKLTRTSTPPLSFSGLAAGASETRVFSEPCVNETKVATVDSLNEVDEANEGNNISSFDQICII